jgi:4-hydroxy-tetrahydrodipicolinate synthase
MIASRAGGRTRSTFVISLTPFDDNGKLDEGRLREHFRRFREARIGVYAAGSGSGEAYTLDPAELAQVLRVAVEELRGSVPVRAMGMEPRTAQQMVDFASLAADVGVDAVQVYSLDIGHAAHPTEPEMHRYYADVLSRIHLPVVLSSHYSVGYLLPITLIKRLSDEFDHIIGVNVTSSDLGYLIDMLDVLDERVDVHVGGPMFALSALAVGANGYLSSEGNIAPKLCQSLIDSYLAGDHSQVFEAYNRIIRLFNVNMRHNAVPSGRAQLEMMGRGVGPPRLPRLPVTDRAALDELAHALDELGIRQSEQVVG